MSFFVYIVECNDGTYYTGYTTDVPARVAAHNGEGKGKDTSGAKYTRGRRPVVLRYSEALPDKPAAMRREWEIKQLARQEKQALITQSHL